MTEHSTLGPWVRRFLLEHVIADRNLSRNTQKSYRDTLALLLPFAAGSADKAIDRITIDHLTVEVIKEFLQYIEATRNCCVATRNQRLAAIHALARFVAERSPEHVAWCAGVRSIPFKKTARPHISYLDKAEIDALLSAAKGESLQSRRDYALLLFLYNSGARASEAAGLVIGNLELRSVAGSQQHVVKVFGKGSKTRYCPLWPATARALSAITAGRGRDEPVFLNRSNQQLTRHGIYLIVERYARKAARQLPTLAEKKVSPHVVRHTTACHLLKAGVDINTIRAWLGHVSLDTTNIYAEIDIEMKSRALAQCEIRGGRSRPWRESPSLMAFLKSL